MGEIFYKAQDARRIPHCCDQVLSRRAAGDEERRRRFIQRARPPAASTPNRHYDLLHSLETKKIFFEESEYIVMGMRRRPHADRDDSQGLHRRAPDALGNTPETAAVPSPCPALTFAGNRPSDLSPQHHGHTTRGA